MRTSHAPHHPGRRAGRRAGRGAGCRVLRQFARSLPGNRGHLLLLRRAGPGAARHGDRRAAGLPRPEPRAGQPGRHAGHPRGSRAAAEGRRAAARRADSRYLGYLIGTVPPPAPASLAGGPARPPGDLAASLAALAAWIATAAAGSYLLAGWLLPGGPRRRPALAAGRPPAIIISHFALALAGLGIWIGFMAAGVAALAWVAVGLIVPAAGLGMAALVTAQPELAPSGGTASPGPALAARMTRTAAHARAGTPVAVIVLHGVLAAATILLAVLAAIGAP